LMITATGIVTCIVSSLVATNIWPARSKAEIEPTLKQQLLISTVLSTVTLLIVSLICLPSTFQMYFMNGEQYQVRNWYCFVAVAGGLWAGLAIGYITEYFTSNQYQPVREVAYSCTTGAATNVIYGLALGYKSTIIPCIALALCIWIGYNMCGVFGIALGALGILSTMSIALTIDAYGPISDNAGGIAEMCEMGEEIRTRTDALDAAGNTTAAIGKGYAIGSAAMVSLALYGAFLTRAYTENNFGKPVHVNIIDPRTFFGLLIGAMLPYWFSALTMKSVGTAAMAMVREIQRQFRVIPGIMEGTNKPEYGECVKIATEASLKEMIAPGALVVLSPIIFGVFFGKEALAGLLPGAMTSGVQMAISASNTGGAWDNAKKYIECGGMGKENGKGSDCHKAAVVGDTIGDPMKDTYGPALNILVKLMAIISVVFAPVVADKHFGGIIFDQLLSTWGQKDAPVSD
jgi:H(+)-translocating pyrophosphatase